MSIDFEATLSDVPITKAAFEHLKGKLFAGENIEQGGCEPARAVPLYYKSRKPAFTTDPSVVCILETEDGKHYEVRDELIRRARNDV